MRRLVGGFVGEMIPFYFRLFTHQTRLFEPKPGRGDKIRTCDLFHPMEIGDRFKTACFWLPWVDLWVSFCSDGQLFGGGNLQIFARSGVDLGEHGGIVTENFRGRAQVYSGFQQHHGAGGS